MNDLFSRELQVINIGLSVFKKVLDESGVPSVQVEWRPPLLVTDSARRVIAGNRERIDQANAKAVKRILEAQPVLFGLAKAIDAIPGMKKNLILHAGPPIPWSRMCGPMQGAVVGALLYENLAKDADAARQLAASGEIEYAPCHEYRAVGPMAGIISPSMPVFMVKNERHHNVAFSTMNEGLGKVLRYGAYSSDVLQRLKWMNDHLFPALRQALERLGRIDLKSIIAQALHMGDEVHNRNRAATSLLFRVLAPELARISANNETTAAVLDFIQKNDHFFLNLSMAAAKVSLDAARDIPGSSILTAMSRNGVEFGIQLSGTGNEWFRGPAPVPDALYFPGFSKADANPDIGDSAITETMGLGGFAIAAAPAIVQFIGGNSRDAMNYTLRMYEITVTENNAYQIPCLDFRGIPTGIDARKVVEKGILPFIDTGVAHQQAGIGQVGAGVLSAPPEPFQAAINRLAATLKQRRTR